LGVRITKDGNHEPEINDRIIKGRAAITKLNSILWNRDVTPKTKTHIYHAIIKSTITYEAETWCLKAIKLQWYGYVQRMEEGRLPKEVMEWCPPGRRKRGRPKLTWAEGIRGLKGEKGLTLIVLMWRIG